MIDYQAQLVSVNLAIVAIEGGAQEYRIGTRTVRRADLQVLYGERRRLEQMISKQSGSMSVAVLGRRGR